MPITAAELPINSPPSDQSPRSMKKRLSTRPNRWCGVSDWTAGWEEAENAKKKNPTSVSDKREKTKEWEKANRPKKSAKPRTHEQIHRMCGRMLPAEASPSAESVAPKPDAAMSMPKPSGPT